MDRITSDISPGPVGGVERRITGWGDPMRRLSDGDPALWGTGPRPEYDDRLGWLDLPGIMRPALDEIRSFADGAGAMTDVVLLGMGGSSLAPGMFSATFGSSPGRPRLTVLDSTHPLAVESVTRRVDPATTLFLVSSKSGTTIETLSLMHHFWAASERAGVAPGPHFAAITDPGSPLSSVAGERGFRACFETVPEVGGRYSALTHFGLVPAALIGVDPVALLDTADAAAADPGGAVDLGALLGEAAAAGRDKATWVTSPALGALPMWAEQLVAESTGKQGTGIVPVAGEDPGPPGVYGEDRVFVAVAVAGDAPLPSLDALQAAGHPVVRTMLPSVAHLGGEMWRNEVAVALAGAVLGVNPFDQPDVERAKTLAREAMEGGDAGPAIAATAPDDDTFDASIAALLGSLDPGGYLALQAFLPPGPSTAGRLETVRHLVRDARRVATTTGFGPRFLHSTGQLHKGGPDGGAFLQIVDGGGPHLPVPGTDFDFGRLIAAQADGDHRALTEAGRTVLRVRLDDVATGLKALEQAVGRAAGS